MRRFIYTYAGLTLGAAALITGVSGQEPPGQLASVVEEAPATTTSTTATTLPAPSTTIPLQIVIWTSEPVQTVVDPPQPVEEDSRELSEVPAAETTTSTVPELANCPRDGTVYQTGSCEVQPGTMPAEPTWTEAKVCPGANWEAPADYPCDYDPATWTCDSTHYSTCRPNSDG
jgi:hypothetical protein